MAGLSVTDQPETSKILDQISKGTNASVTRKQQNARRRFIFVLFLLMPLFGATGLLGYKQFEMQAALTSLRSAEEKTDDLNLVLRRQAEEMQRLREQVATLSILKDRNESESVALQVRIDSDLEQLDRRVAELSEASIESAAPQNSRWKILEANYIARLAAQKLEFERDILSATALLQRSDRALSESGSTSVLNARQQLAKDIEVLRSTSVFDQEEVIFRLQSLSERVESISLIGSLREKLHSEQTGLSVEADNIVRDTSGMLDTTLEFLGTVFVWRKWEDPPETILFSGQDGVIRQSFRLMLEQSKFAVTNRSNTLYQHHMQNALKWFRTYIVIEAGSGAAAYHELEELAALNIDPELPSFSAFLSDLEQLAASVR
ncbi:MAG: hypothetical protein CMD92_10555 [Gammaproteobacteria bacterium]|nr:hypothetical protein [Gammaproteobacteria bacterium]|tara:strand:+ start:3612 stop:4742 length:1131 start_codon:yes stop_codon:yes gene_type:complete